MSRLRLILLALVACAALLAAGCGDDGGGDETDPATMKSEFDEAAESAYEAEEANREEDFKRGVPLTENCFILDQEGADAIAEALGSESGEITATSFLSGEPGKDELLTCTLVDDKGVGFATIIAGTTQATPKELRQQAPLNEPIEGTAPGLDPADVAAVVAGFSRRYAWISDEFVVGVVRPSKAQNEQLGFESLSVAVDEVARTLSSGD